VFLVDEKASDSSPSGHRERLRQRFGENPSQLTDAQRLELLLTFAIPRRDVAPLATTLIDRFGSLDALFQADRSALTAISGVGDQSAALIQLVGLLRGQALRPANGSSPASPPLPNGEPVTLFGAPASAKAPSKSRTTPRPATPKSDVQTLPVKPPAAPRKIGMPKRRRSGLFSAGVFGDAARLVQKIPLDADPDAARKFLQNNGLHYSSATTRNRYASYIVTRLFPAKQVDTVTGRAKPATDGRAKTGHFEAQEIRALPLSPGSRREQADRWRISSRWRKSRQS
jgi:hypothetical protein